MKFHIVLLKICYLLIVFLFLSNLLFSQTTEKRLALVIGNANYKNGTLLKNPVNDANLMATTLQELNFTVLKHTNVSKSDLERAIYDFTIKLRNYNVALFYYAGHGIQIGGINYLIPTDATLDDEIAVEFEAVDVGKVVKQFENYPDNLNIVILDACRDTPFRSWQRGSNRGFKAFSAQPKGTIIAFATREGETASDGAGNNGLFTEYLVKQMKQPQQIEDVFKNTRIAVLDASNNMQMPQEWNMLTSSFSFVEGDNLADNKYNLEKYHNIGYLDIKTNVEKPIILANYKTYCFDCPYPINSNLPIEISFTGYVNEKFNVPIQRNLLTTVNVNMVKNPEPLISTNNFESLRLNNKTWESFYFTPSNLKPESINKSRAWEYAGWGVLIGIPLAALANLIEPPDPGEGIYMYSAGMFLCGIIGALCGADESKPRVSYENIKYNDNLKAEAKAEALSNFRKYVENYNKEIKIENEIKKSKRSIRYKVGDGKFIVIE